MLFEHSFMNTSKIFLTMKKSLLTSRMVLSEHFPYYTFSHSATCLLDTSDWQIQICRGLNFVDTTAYVYELNQDQPFSRIICLSCHARFRYIGVWKPQNKWSVLIFNEQLWITRRIHYTLRKKSVWYLGL